uniref:G-protein coupled receptors family 1 profile domain-containing protein n=1 Tax=Parascaris equorum TaxID=6256 RepID=A0A914RS72_PAREQ
MASEHLTTLVGGVYIFIGVVGFVCNTATVLMIATNRVYRLSAYTIMANIALADAIMMLVAGVVCGSLIAWTPMRKPPLNMKVDTAFGMPILIGSTSSGVSKPPIPNVQPLQSLERHQLFARESFNRCIAIRFYGTKAKSVNRVSVALFASLVTWAIAIITGPLILFLFYFCC